MTENSLILFTQANKMLAEATTIQKAKELKSLALTAAEWAKQKKLGNEAVQYARGYALEADRKIGELLKETERAKGKRTDLVPKEYQVERPTLADLGLTKKESSDAQFLANLNDADFEKIKTGKTSKQAVKRKQEQQVDSKAIATKTFPVIEGKFKTILIDPPWDYGALSLAGRGHPEYATMSLEELQDLAIDKYAEENCHLYLWTTNNFLYEALRLGIGWGFSYKTIITWVKPSMGMGSYFRNNTEQLLFFVKGNLQTRTNNTLTHFEASRGAHSEKPEESYQLIEANSYPAYLEYFGRKRRENWTVFGNV